MAGLDTLAEALDRWAAAGRVAVTETDDVVVAYQLDGAEARELARLAAGAGLDEVAFQDEGGELDLAQITDGLTRITARMALPPPPPDVERILTNTAFAAALDRSQIRSRVWVRRLSAAFVTVGVRYSPWDDAGAPAPPEPSWPHLRKIVRVLGSVTEAQADLPRWILRDADTPAPVDNPAFGVWRAQATTAVAVALANELEPDGRLLFRGPPTSRFRRANRHELTPTAFSDLQRAARWAYENPREVENRQGLLAAEIARAAVRDGDLPALADLLVHALDGARIAYQFGVAQQSRDALKALSDLRKAVIEETSKVSEVTRGLAAAVAGAVFGNVGLIVARLTLPPNNSFIGPAAVLVGIVLALYVATVIASGLQFLAIQRRNRGEWRPRLYSFLAPADYATLVERPVKRAEFAFYVAAALGAIMGAVLLVAVLVIASSPAPPASPMSRTSGVDSRRTPGAAEPERSAPGSAKPPIPAPEGQPKGSPRQRMDKPQTEVPRVRVEGAKTKP